MSENPSAFPVVAENGLGHVSDGMSLWDYFAGQAMANSAICHGNAADWQLTEWFGPSACNITKWQIVAKQAREYADAMLAEREKGERG